MGFGMMRLPQLDENDFSSVDFEQVKKMACRTLSKRLICNCRQDADFLNH